MKLHIYFTAFFTNRLKSFFSGKKILQPNIFHGPSKNWFLNYFRGGLGYTHEIIPCYHPSIEIKHVLSQVFDFAWYLPNIQSCLFKIATLFHFPTVRHMSVYLVIIKLWKHYWNNCSGIAAPHISFLIMYKLTLHGFEIWTVNA